MKNNNSSIKTVVAVGIGAALFFVLGRFVAIPSPVPNTNISLQYAVLALLAGHPVLSFLYHPLVPYCALVALVFAVSYAIYWKTKDPRFRLYLSDAYVHVGLGIIVVNFLVKNYLLAAKGIDILEQLPGW